MFAPVRIRSLKPLVYGVFVRASNATAPERTPDLAILATPRSAAKRLDRRLIARDLDRRLRPPTASPRCDSSPEVRAGGQAPRPDASGSIVQPLRSSRCTSAVRSGPPSRRSTEREPDSLSRAATTHPAAPPPTTTTSNTVRPVPAQPRSCPGAAFPYPATRPRRSGRASARAAHPALPSAR
jgi:hypothetical protein